MPSTPPPSHGLEELALLAYLEHLLRGRRVLYVGRPRAQREAWEASCALFDTLPAPASVAAAYDVVVMGERVGGEAATAMSSAVAWARDILSPNGLLIAAAAAAAGSEPDLPAAYRALHAALSTQFSCVRMLGQLPFAGFALVDFTSRDPNVAAQAADSLAPALASLTDIAVDTTRVDTASTPFRAYYAVATSQAVGLEPMTIVQVPACVIDAGDYATLSRAQCDTEVEWAQLESQLRERAGRVRALEREVQRRGSLLRDHIEQRAAMPRPSEALQARCAAATQRALEAEAARAAAEFTLDEVTGHLTWLRRRYATAEAEGAHEAASVRTPVAAQAQEGCARLEGECRGLRARMAETERSAKGRIRQAKDQAAERLALLQCAEKELEACRATNPAHDSEATSVRSARAETLRESLREVRGALIDLSDAVEQMGQGAGGSLAPPPMRMAEAAEDDTLPLGPTAQNQALQPEVERPRADYAAREARMREQSRAKDDEARLLRAKLLQVRVELEKVLAHSPELARGGLSTVLRLLD